MINPLEQRIAMVTGATRGIGRACAISLAQAGAAVIVNYRDDENEALSVVKAIAQNGGTAHAVQGDVRNEDQVVRLFAEARQKLAASPDIVVNNAGVIFERPLVDTSMADFDALMSVNLRGAFMVGRQALREMSGRKAAHCRLINITSDLAYTGRAQYSVYSASKAGLLALTKSWAREFAPNILVNAVAPGPTNTDMLGLETMSPQWRQKEEDNPLQRIGEPHEIAAAVVFLAGPGGSFMTGQTLGPNGGTVMV